MYGTAAMVFFIVGGVEALLIRAQLWAPRGTLLSAELYNQVFTMHGTTMVFLVVMPIGAAFANYLMPLQIGARDVAFPRINAFSFWCFLAGGLFLNSSWLFGGGADGGWFMYAPNSGVLFSPGHGIDFWNLGLIITGIASLTGAINLIVTVLNLRCPGMTPHAHAGVHLDDPGDAVPAAVRHPGADRRAVPAHVRPALRRQLLQRGDRAATRCCGSTCSGSSATPRCT